MRRLSIACSNGGGGGGGGGKGLTYKDAGVDIDAGAELVKRIAKMAPGIGGFGGLYPWGIAPSLYLFEIFLFLLSFP